MKKNISFAKKIDFPTMIGEITAIDLEHTLKFTDESNIEGELIVKGKYKLTEASRLEEDFSYKIPTEISLTEKLDLDTASIDIVDFYYEIENDDIMICNIELKVEGLEIIELEDTIEDEKEEELPPEHNKEQEKTLKTEEEVLESKRTIKNEILEPSLERSTTIEEDTERECDGEEKELEIPKKEDTTSKKEAKIPKDQEEPKIYIQKEEPKNMIDPQETIRNDQEKKESTQNLKSLFLNLSDDEETFSTYSVYILRQEETITQILEKYKTTKEEVEKYNDLNNMSVGSKIIIPIINE